MTQPLSLRAASSRHPGSSVASIQRIVTRLETGFTPQQVGRPRVLTDEEDEAIVAFVIWMERSGFPASKPEIEDAATTLRQRRNPDADPVSKMWYARFRDNHPELEQAFLKAAEQSRESWEAGGLDDLKQWFKNLTETIRSHNISASECWNTDQAGIRIGILRESVKVLVVRTRRRTRKQVLSPSNRETCTLIGTGSAAGDTMPPWLIFKTWPTLDWAYIDADPDIRFAQSDTAFSNGEITLEWMIHFNRCSWAKSAKAQQILCESTFNMIFPPISHAADTTIWRLIVFDGFTGHGVFAVREYCAKFCIITAPLPPHSTHVLQPMDVGVFQPLKNAHQKLLGKWLRKGNISFSRTDFVRGFQEVFEEGFTAHNIISGFEKSGIYPPNPKPAIAYLAKKQLQAKQAVDPAFASLLPQESRFQAAADTAKRLSDRYGDTFSSPTRAGLRQIRNVVTEAVVLESTVTAYVDDRRARIEKRYNATKRGKRAKPIGDFSHNVSLQEIRDQQEEVIAEARQKEEKAQVRTARSLVIQEMKKIKDQWRQEKEITVDGVKKKASWAQWLEHTGKDIEYYSMETQRSTMHQILTQKPDPFMIDTQLPQEVHEAIHNASFAPKPLSAMDWTALAGSDDSITFQLEPAPAEEDEDDEELPLFEPLLRMPSSPPVTPSPPRLPSLPPGPPSTPCPIRPQHHISGIQRITGIITRARAAQEASPEG
ncbi:HTH CENPB-type domain-containing protein [Fusarium keratoplasticum]|uniref:HTH CENPB-type domain-containing protein n=1 Tax=Fusarium keratoplasticum TaxID=1328300 RepID=A0ACC0QFY0_9HYPO|nr:HTH CENPB-type domain-containing protein [Fusarium keratoplasticum]KAI8654437.1 HTH CENPB-type domain-containing protein [Fusarium keratoplasticum]